MQRLEDRCTASPPDSPAEAPEPTLQEKPPAILDRADGKLTPQDFFEGAALIGETTRGIPQTDSAIIQRRMRDE